LQHFSGQIERKIFGVDNSFDETKPLWNKLLAIISDENSSDIELDVVLFLLGLEEIEWSTFGYKEDSAELKLTFN
jgi:hypothetical protein